MNGYEYWTKSLAGLKPKAFVDQPELGFYRMPVREFLPLKNGQGSAWKRTGWTPVAIFLSGKEPVAVVGTRDTAKLIDGRDRLNEIWTHVSANFISEDVYRAVSERGEPWPDSHETVAAIPADHSLKISPHAHIEIQIEHAEENLRHFLEPIDSDEMASKARSLQLKFLELKGEAEEQYETVNRPLLDEQKRLRGIWFPLRDRADTHAKTLRRAQEGWNDTKLEAAKRAAETGQASNMPPPSTQIKAATGRAASVTVEKVVTAIDVEKVFQQFKTAPQVIELLTILAQKAIRSGIDVPGATFEERSVVR